MSADEATQENLPRAAAPNFSDHTFRSRSGVELAVRVWPAEPPTSSPAPFVSWTHGGGNLAGHHFTPLAWMNSGFRQRGYHLVSHNYRLSPQARIDEQLDDCVEAIEWCRENLPAILGADRVDVDRYVVCGESAGGIMSTLLGHRLSPPPRAIIDVYGVVDFLGHGVGVSTPKSSETADPPEWTGEFSQDQLEAYLDDRDPKNILTDALFWTEKDILSEAALSERIRADFKYTERVRLQAELHIFRSTRLPGTGLLRAAFHQEKFGSPEELREFVASLCSLRLLEGKTSYPPTAIIHGTADSSVPLEQSQAFARKLREMGVPVIESYEPGGEHVFDDKYTVSMKSVPLTHPHH